MKFKIFDAEFEADMLDYDYMVKVESELEGVEKKIHDIKEKAILDGMRQSVLVKESTEVIHRFFDVVFGDGAAQKIFKGKIHYGAALKAFGEYILQKNAHSGDDIREINDEYTPKIQATKAIPEDRTGSGNNKPANVQQYNGNRAQKRNAQKKKGKKNPNKYHK